MAIANYENAGFNVCIIPIQYFTQNYYYSFDDPGITFGDNLLDFRIEGVENEVFNYNGIRLTVQYSSGTTGILIYLYNENTIVFSANDGNSYLTYGLALGIDDSQHLGYISIVRTISGTRYGIFTAYEYGSLDYYNWIKGIPLPIIYQWQSVPSVSGKNGISLLSIIKSSAINSGDPVSGASADAFDRLEETTKISTLIQGITEETPIIYSDDVNYMSITPTANNTCTLKFYLHGSVIYTLTDVSINAYLSFLIDETNGIMKPSIIYEDS